tara:strand:- start:2067 stop:4532 length:2466 start_codon:yes stop_codon:yes gene_type:complete
MSESDDIDLTPLSAHKNTWTQRDLLAGIIGRYMTVKSHLGGLWPTWDVEAEHLDKRLIELNSYLEKLGWMARLRRGENNQLTALPLPHSQFPGRRIHVYMWIASIITVLLSGVRWMDSGRPEGGWFAESVYLDAFIGYVLPILFTLGIASFAQAKISAHYGVRSGYILPIPDPSILLWLFSGLSASYFIWPFGIFFLPTLPRMDARPWPNRKSLAYSSLSVPLVMLFSGFVFWTVGIFLSADPFTLTSEPMRLNAPFLIELFGSGFDQYFDIHLDWSHPFLFSAAYLTLVGWLLLLPIPTFPGGRLLVSRMGMHEARSSGTQILMFMILITAAFFIFNAFEGFTIWIPILAVILPLLLFIGGDPRIPVLLDGDVPLDEESHRSLGIILFVALLFAIPAEFPIEPVDRWDFDLEYEIKDVPPAELVGDYWNSTQTITLQNPSMQADTYNISIASKSSSDWTSELSCETTNCEGILASDDSISITVDFSHMNSTIVPTFLVYDITLVLGDEQFVEPYTMYPNLNSSVGSEWSYLRTESGVLTCLPVYLIEESSALASLPDLDSEWASYLWFDGEAGLETEVNWQSESICLESNDQGLTNSLSTELSVVELDGNQFHVGFNKTWPHVVSASETGWLVNNEIGWGSPFENDSSLLYRENSTSCTGNEFLSTPRHSNTTNWTWDLSIWPSQKIPELNVNESIHVKFPTAYYYHCNFESLEQTRFKIEEGPDMVLVMNNQTLRLWDAPLEIIGESVIFSLYNSNNESILLRHETNGDAPWDLSNLTDVLPKGWTHIDISVPNADITTVQLIHQDGAIMLYFGGYLEG